MINFMKHKDKILEVTKMNCTIAVTMDGQVDRCMKLGCKNCILEKRLMKDGVRSCQHARMNWFYEEAEEV